MTAMWKNGRRFIVILTVMTASVWSISPTMSTRSHCSLSVKRSIFPKQGSCNKLFLLILSIQLLLIFETCILPSKLPPFSWFWSRESVQPSDKNYTATSIGTKISIFWRAIICRLKHSPSHSTFTPSSRHTYSFKQPPPPPFTPPTFSSPSGYTSWLTLPPVYPLPDVFSPADTYSFTSPFTRHLSTTPPPRRAATLHPSPFYFLWGGAVGGLRGCVNPERGFGVNNICKGVGLNTWTNRGAVRLNAHFI